MKQTERIEPSNECKQKERKVKKIDTVGTATSQNKSHERSEKEKPKKGMKEDSKRPESDREAGEVFDCVDLDMELTDRDHEMFPSDDEANY